VTKHHDSVNLAEVGKKLLHLLDRFTETTDAMVARELKERGLKPPPVPAVEPKIPAKLTPAEYGLIRLLRRTDVSRETSETDLFTVIDAYAKNGEMITLYKDRDSDGQRIVYRVKGLET
jgi:hypothetical protein